jgi:aryl-alcohol dehydrogenase-like predicted oxidoreductase
MTLTENQQKLAAVNELGKLAEDRGITIIDLAMGFVLAHPDVTCPIIGPRTMEQLESLLPTADVKLDTSVLDRIDEIVPPGIDLNPGDKGWVAPSVEDAKLRRR